MLYTTPPTRSTCSNCPKTNPTQTIVVKVDYPNHQDLTALFQDTAQIVAQGHDLILVWGDRREGAPQMSMPQVVSHLQTLGVNAIGLSGQDGRLIQARPVHVSPAGNNLAGDTKARAGLWEIERVNMGLLCLLSGAGYTLVIDPTTLSPQDGTVMLDGDQAALGIAIAVRADIMLVLTGLCEYHPTGGGAFSRGQDARLTDEALILKDRLKGNLRHILLSEGVGPYPISGALWDHGSSLPISGINTLWMQSSLAT